MTKRIPNTKEAIIAHLTKHGPTTPVDLWYAVPVNLGTLVNAIATLKIDEKIVEIIEGGQVKLKICQSEPGKVE